MEHNRDSVHTHRAQAPCPACGFDLVDAPAIGDCPSCAEPMNANCINCGYDISATAPKGDCPECGQLVARSLSFELGIEPARALLRAIRFVFWGTIALYAFSILGVLVVIAIGFIQTLPGPGASSGFVASHWTTAIGGLAYSIVIACAWWVLTKPLPGTPRALDVPASRRALRTLLVVSVGLSIVALVKPLVMPFVPPPAAVPQPAGIPAGVPAFSWSSVFTPSLIGDIALGLMNTVIAATLMFFQARYLRFVSKRTPGHPGLTLAEVNVWLVPLLATVGILACGMGPLAASVMLLVHLGILEASVKRYVRATGAPVHDA
ncbi:MAG: hypothetical protein AAGH64_05895 [Planctomycetota bacterium]